MDNLTDLKAIWHTAKTDSLPTSAEMLKLIKQFRRQRLKKKWMIIIGASFLTVVMVFGMITYHSKLLTTLIGEVLIIASMVLLAATNIKSLKRFYQLDDCSNLEFLDFIEQTRQNQIYYYKKTQVAIMLLCSVGLLLYMYELASRHQSWFIGIYAGISVYLLVIWLVVRPYFFKKNAKKLSNVRIRLEKLSKQLK